MSWTKPQNSKLRPTAILDENGRVVMTKSKNWDEFQRQIPEGGDPTLTIITEQNNVDCVSLKTALWFTSVEYKELEMEKETGWRMAIGQNKAQGGTMGTPLMILDRKIWWGIKDFGPLVQLFKQLQQDSVGSQPQKQ